MIKRPLLYWFAAFVIGIIAGHFRSKNFVFCCAFLAAVTAAGWIFFYEAHILAVKRKDYFLLVMPLCFLVGAYLVVKQAEPSQLEKILSAKTKGRISGRVISISQKEENYQLVLEDIICKLSSKDEIFQVKKQFLSVSALGELKIGNQITAEAVFYPIIPASNPGQFDAYQYYKSEGISCNAFAERFQITDNKVLWFRQTLYNIKQSFLDAFEALYKKNDYGILAAMLLGEKKLLDGDIKLLYQQNGISHILAISGLHISLLGLSFYHLLRKRGIRIIISVLLPTLFILCYGIFCGFSVSVSRAVFMFLCSLLAVMLGKTYDLLSACSLSGMLILLYSPMQLFQAGFLLSFGAVFGIAVFQQVMCKLDLFVKKGLLSGLLQAFAASAAIQLFTIPILLYFFFEIPVYSVLLNLIVLPCLSILVPAAFLSGVLSFFSFPIGYFIAGGVHYVLKFYEFLCSLISLLPKPVLRVGRPDSIQICCYYGILCIFIILCYIYKKRGCFVLLIILLFILKKRSITSFEIAFLDVGQGDCIIMQGADMVMMIDGGSSDIKNVGINRILPFLKAKGIDTLDIVAISHPDADHISGILELIEIMPDQITIKKILLADLGEKEEAYIRIEQAAAAKNISINYIGAGDAYKKEEIRLLCMHPEKGFISSSRNDGSMVLSVVYKNFSVILTGDLTAEGEERVLTFLKKFRFDLRDTNLLKVAHHGSGYSSIMSFLDAVDPETAVISCARNNSYGHPNQDVLMRLDRVNTNVLLTMELGAVEVLTDGEKYIVKPYLTHQESPRFLAKRKRG